jgi:hypothetical protein
LKTLGTGEHSCWTIANSSLVGLRAARRSNGVANMAGSAAKRKSMSGGKDATSFGSMTRRASNSDSPFLDSIEPAADFAKALVEDVLARTPASETPPMVVIFPASPPDETVVTAFDPRYFVDDTGIEKLLTQDLAALIQDVGAPIAVLVAIGRRCGDESNIGKLDTEFVILDAACETPRADREVEVAVVVDVISTDSHQVHVGVVDHGCRGWSVVEWEPAQDGAVPVGWIARAIQSELRRSITAVS